MSKTGFALALSARLEELQLTQTSLAEELGVTQQTVSRWALALGMPRAITRPDLERALQWRLGTVNLLEREADEEPVPRASVSASAPPDDSALPQPEAVTDVHVELNELVADQTNDLMLLRRENRRLRAALIAALRRLEEAHADYRRYVEDE